MNKKKHSPRSTNIVVIGDGLADLAGLHKLQRLRLHHLHRPWAQMFEASHAVVGTWCRAIDNPNFDLATKTATATATTRANDMLAVTS